MERSSFSTGRSSFRFHPGSRCKKSSITERSDVLGSYERSSLWPHIASDSGQAGELSGIISGAESRCRMALNGPEHDGTRFESFIEGFENRHTKGAPISSHGAMADGLRSTYFGAVWTWRGWFAVQREARAFPRIRPRLGPINTASGQRQKLCNTVVTVFESRDEEPASVSHREVDRPTAHGASDAVRTWRGCVVGQRANTRHTPPHAVGRGSTPPTVRSVGGESFETS